MNVSDGRFRGIARLLDVDARFTGAGLTFEIGALLPQTGAGAAYGDRIGDIPALAFRHIAAMGGPRFRIRMRDNRTGDPLAGASALDEFAAAKIPMMLSSYAANLGSLLPDIERYEILALDGGGGAPLYAQGKPYFWGSIATSPNDALAGTIAFIRETMPEATRFFSLSWELGGLDAAITLDALRYFAGTGLAMAAMTKVKLGSTDFSAAIAAIRQSDCDLVLCHLYGDDVGYFMKQYAASDIGKPVFAFTHSPSAQRIAGTAYDGLYFAFDYFDPQRPANPWAEFLVDEFRELETPDYKLDCYLANAYEDLFVFWACIRRVLQKGGDPHSGRELDAALRDDPSFPSLYGGDARSPGTLRFDLATHSVDYRPMTLAQVVDGKIVPLAHFRSGRPAFELV